mmetsp:Transcript_5745/g.13075  ORF Transcript_5745/g.13075 Transcript_5745/m.13075 type:complete len:695 (-) Transcript_5745:199-2283(-)|eukprot:CAMPEP_0172313904 /NCGR_PEP_ID=MMETSP1058-20130122/21237_1 /TAXON_ID=83371 /ORGANISM="Detonula confervacea, Strain CCMP 353" /LENGTH=694 /DNA_ID=CAMNT_0013027639 /DNA_START=109 /DNA_END=2193 /DNA_ORIENTATION=-
MVDNSTAPSPVGVISSPTQNPVGQPLPTLSPPASLAPSSSPARTLTTPTSESPAASQLPSFAPSAAPSVAVEIYSDSGFKTQLYVFQERLMSDTEQFIFQEIMKSHTERIGLNITTPFIKTYCTILKQELGKTKPKLRQRNLQQNANSIASNIILTVTYRMNYTSRYGHTEIYDYPQDFLDYMNENATVTHDLLLKSFSDIVPGEVYIQTVGDTVSANVTGLTTANPTPTPANLENNVMPTANPSAMISMPPSSMPSNRVTERVSTIIPGTEMSDFLIGILVALVVVACSTIIAVSYRFYWQKRRGREDANTTDVKEHRENEPHVKETAAMAAAQDQLSGGISSSILDRKDSEGDSRNSNGVNASVAIPIDQNYAEADTMTTPETAKMTQQSSNMGISATAENRERSGLFASNLAQTGLGYSTIDSMLTVGTDRLNENGKDGTGAPHNASRRESPSGIFVGANLMANHSDSSSLDSFEETLSSHVTIGDGDEFDKYRNQLLETLRIKVESSVDDIDGMMSLAITRILLDTEGTPLDLSWVGGEDLGSIEASCLCQAFELARKNESSTGRIFFEDMLNKIGIIVHHGLIRPHDGARILHGCASVVGLPLIKKCENTTVAVHGLLKTNDLARGQHLLVEAFAPFGDIVDASIAPQNRGFGFVRFVRSESVDTVLKKHRTTMWEIEIEDVAVSIKTL